MTDQPQQIPPESGYQAFLVRLWKDGADALWRGSVQSVQTGETVRFVSLSELFAYLEAQTGAPPEDKTSFQ